MLAVVVAVVNGVALKLDVVGDGMSAEMVEGVVGAELFHVHLAMCHDVAHEVDVFQVAHDVELALAPCLHIVQEAAAEVLHELQACVVGLDAQVYVVALGRYVSVDHGEVLGAVLCRCVDVDLSFLVVVGCLGMKGSQGAVLEDKVLDVEVGVGLRSLEDRLHHGLARSFSGKVDRVEVDQVEDIGYVDILQVGHDGVGGLGGGFSVDDNVLVAMREVEHIDRQFVLSVHDGGRVEKPFFLSEHDF